MSDRLTAFPSHQKRQFGVRERTERRIMHIDMDAYFAALEQKANPKLLGKPVVVGSTDAKRGVVSTASYESRVYGIHSGMPTAEAKRLCPHAVFIGVDPNHYISVSAELRKIFDEFSPRVESVSVDEAFLDVSGCGDVFGSEEELSCQLKARIRTKLGLTCSIGIAPSKIMAKLASSVFKPDGLTILYGLRDVESVLYPLPVEKMWGIGPVSAESLQRSGIKTIGDLARFDLRKLRAMLGQNGEAMGRIARGDDCSPVLSQNEQPDEKSIGHERTFPHDSSDPEYLHATLYYLADLVARRMRRNGFRGRTITIRIRYSDFTTLTRRTTFRNATDQQAVIYHHAIQLLNTHWKNDGRLRLLGVSMSQLEPISVKCAQSDLFAAATNHSGVDAVVDRIRDRYGENAIGGAVSHLRSSDS